MPLYDFSCPKCKEDFEELVFGDEVPSCPKCGEKETRRLVSCACLHMPAHSRAGQTVKFPKSSGSACGGCAGGSCSTCK